jgi:ABC-2 type transport system permease protein
MALGFVRDRTSLFFTIAFPLMFLVLFGGIFANRNVPPPHVLQIGPVALLDNIPAAQRADLDKALHITRDDNLDDALSQVRQGSVTGAVEENGSSIVLHYSAADATAAGELQGLFSSLVDSGNLAAAGVTKTAFELTATQVEDQSLKTIQYVTPGLLGWAIATGATFGAALTLISWRQKKILRRLRLAPVRSSSIALARVGVSVAIALVQMAIFIGIASLPYFGLKLSADWWMAIPLVIAGTLSFLAIGLLAGSFTKTPEAGSAVANLIVLPMAFLSGSFFPLDGAPGWLRAISQALPLTHLRDGMVAVMVRGESAASVLPQLGVLLAFAVVVSGMAMVLFRWEDA